MTRAQMICAVARHTGESVRTVRHRGFSLLTEDARDLEPEEIVLRLDCPFCRRPAAYPGTERHVAECDHCDLEFDFSADEVYTAAARGIDEAAAAGPIESAREHAQACYS
jgi:ribosomal protein L37AE/L43A